MVINRICNRVAFRVVGMAAIAAACMSGTAAASVVAEPAETTATTSAAAAPAPPKLLQTYDMSWWSVDGGGGSSSGGTFAVTGSVGQPDAGSARGCGTAVAGGVWAGPEPCEAPMFCDGFEDGGTGAWSSATP